MSLKYPIEFLGDGVRGLVSETTARAVLAATLAVCLLAFVFGLNPHFIAGLLILGFLTAVIESRLHGARRDSDASR